MFNLCLTVNAWQRAVLKYLGIFYIFDYKNDDQCQPLMPQVIMILTNAHASLLFFLLDFFEDIYY